MIHSLIPLKATNFFSFSYKSNLLHKLTVLVDSQYLNLYYIQKILLLFSDKAHLSLKE